MGGGGMGGMGGGRMGGGGMGGGGMGGGGMGGFGGGGMGGNPFGGGGGGYNPANYGCNSRNSGFSSVNNGGAAFGSAAANLSNQPNNRFNDRFNNTAFGNNRPDTSICSGTSAFGNPFGNGDGRGGGGPTSVMRSAMLETMVKEANGRMIMLDLAAFSTDAGATQTVQRIVGLGSSISEDLRGQYTIGYYTTSTEPIEKRIDVKVSFDRMREEEAEYMETLPKERLEL
jgi:hypothetical protein